MKKDDDGLDQGITLAGPVFGFVAAILALLILIIA
jgi:hypothetical protein